MANATRRTLYDVIQQNKAIRNYWFEPDTMRFFRTRLSWDLYGGRYFVTSEAHPYSSYGDRRTRTRRLYTVRIANDDGTIATHGGMDGFGAYRTRAQAIAAAKRAAREEG